MSLVLLLLGLWLAAASCPQYATLPLDGSPVSGSLGFNEYLYFSFVPSQSGNVDLTQTASVSPYGVWTFIGAGYVPIDGRSDWDWGTIAAYAESFVVENVRAGDCYVVGVWHGESDTASFELTAKLDVEPYTPPTNLTVGDMPTEGIVDAAQYSDFFVTPSTSGNLSISLFANAHLATLLALPHALPRLGNRQAELALNCTGKWESLIVPWVRAGTTIGLSVWSGDGTAFDIRVDAQTGVDADADVPRGEA